MRTPVRAPTTPPPTDFPIFRHRYDTFRNAWTHLCLQKKSFGILVPMTVGQIIFVTIKVSGRKFKTFLFLIRFKCIKFCHNRVRLSCQQWKCNFYKGYPRPLKVTDTFCQFCRFATEIGNIPPVWLWEHLRWRYVKKVCFSVSSQLAEFLR